MKKQVLKIVLLVGAFLFITIIDSAAQRGKAKAKGQENTTGVPIDGGVGVLLAAGAAYGFKKLRDHRKNNKEDASI